LRNRFVIGNWKLNGSHARNAELLAALLRVVTASIRGKNCAVCVPSPYLAQTQAVLSGSPLGWGAQDVSRFDTGAYTGEVSATMVTEFGSRYAIVGHSERRALFGDMDAVVAEKFGRARAAGLTAVLCVGETLAEREAGHTESVVTRQLEAVTAVHGADGLADAIVAYEPVWAIGTGKTATPMQAQEVHGFLRGWVAKKNRSVADTLPILYGGSVKKSNAAELFAMPDIDGGLIGGASLVADEFLGIWAAL
jgi:triosephosphate isomerase (TIM)